MRSTEDGLRLDGTSSSFLLIAFEDDERRGIGTATTMTRTGRVRGFVALASSLVRVILIGTRWFGFVGAITRLVQFPLTLAVLFLPGLLVSAFPGICHVVPHVDEGDNAVVAILGRGNSQNRAGEADFHTCLESTTRRASPGDTSSASYTVE